MAKASTTLSSFLDIAGGYATSKVITTAARIGLFSPPYEPISPAAFSKKHHIPEKGVYFLLNALVALEICKKSGDHYVFRDEIRHLFESFPGLPWDLIHQDHLYDVWGRLEKAILTGRSPDPPEEELERYPASLEIFLRAMQAHSYALTPEILSSQKWDSVHQLLDIGGGGAGFALALTRHFDDLNVTIVDLPDAIAQTEKIIASELESRRISLVVCDAFNDPLPNGPFDRVLISHLLHIYPARENKTLIEKAAWCLKTGGDLLLLDYFLNNDETAPREAVLFRLLMMIGTPSGDCYPLSAAQTWLNQSHLIPQNVIPLGRGNTLITALKP